MSILDRFSTSNFAARSIRAQSSKFRPVPKSPFRTLGDVVSKPTPGEREIYGEINKRMLRMFDAAVTTNLNTDFPVTITSANAEIYNSIISSRSRSRTLDRDNPFAVGIREAYIDGVGGEEPFRLEMNVGKKNAKGEFTEEEDTNDEIEEAWRKAGMPENCCADGTMSRSEMDWQAIAALVRDGGILYRHHHLYPYNRCHYAIEPIEIDRLDSFYMRPDKGDGTEVQFVGGY